MQSIKRLWSDEDGLVLSAEVVTVGTLGVLGAVVGLNAASTAVDQELKEFAGAIRSLDQSYGYVGHQSCRAWTAGSCYRQQDVQQSLADLCSDGAADLQAIENHVKSQRSVRLPVAPHPTLDADEPTPVTPNQIPVPQLKQSPVQPETSAPATGPKKTRRNEKKGGPSEA